MNLLDTLIKGGPLMIFIGACSITTIAIALERWIRLRIRKIMPDGFAEEIKRLIKRKRLSDAIDLCMDRNELGVRVIRAGLNCAGAKRDVIREHFEMEGRQAYQEMTRGLGVLATVASISPLLGLMGTVTGMIRVFGVISVQGVGDPGALSGGISEALITTAAGLAVGIPTLVLHHYFLRRTEQITSSLEHTSSDILDLLDPDTPTKNGGIS